jgi:hypothetical protein
MGQRLLRSVCFSGLLSLLILTACNPQSQLGIGVMEDQIIPDGTSVVSSGLSFHSGRLLVSKAINKDLFGALGFQFCFDNSNDSKFGCATAVGTDAIPDANPDKPVFLRKIQFHLINRSDMYGQSASDVDDELTVSFPSATLTTAIPALNPDTGDFVYVQREQWRWDEDSNGVRTGPTKITSVSQNTCVPGVNGAVGFNDQPGYALTGLHVFEEGVSYSTSLNSMHAAKVDVEAVSIYQDGSQLADGNPVNKSFGMYRSGVVPAGRLVPSPELRVPENAGNMGPPGSLPRVITGICIRSVKRNGSLIRVGIFGLRGVFYKARFR